MQKVTELQKFSIKITEITNIWHLNPQKMEPIGDIWRPFISSYLGKSWSVTFFDKFWSVTFLVCHETMISEKGCQPSEKVGDLWDILSKK